MSVPLCHCGEELVHDIIPSDDGSSLAHGMQASLQSKKRGLAGVRASSPLAWTRTTPAFCTLGNLLKALVCAGHLFAKSDDVVS